MFNLSRILENDVNKLIAQGSKYSKIISAVILQKQIFYFLLRSHFNYVTKCFLESAFRRNSATPFLFSKLPFGRRRHLFTESEESNEVQRSYDTISYIVYARLLPSNNQIVVSKVDGAPLTVFSAGTDLFKGKQKINKLALNEMTRKLIVKSRRLETTGIFAVSLKGLRRYRSILLTRLKDIYPVKVVKTNNLTPHNGCRAKKPRK